MKLNKIVLGLITLLATISFAQVQFEQEEDSSIPATAQEIEEMRQEIVQLIQKDTTPNPNHSCALEALKNKQPGQVLKVKQGWRDSIDIQGSFQDWKNTAKQCDPSQAYYEVIANAKGQTGNTEYRFRNLSYVYSDKMSSRVNFYSPVMNEQEMRAFVAQLRSLSAGKITDLGDFDARKTFQKTTIIGKNGKELLLTSLEQRLLERAQECQRYAKPNEEMSCEQMGYEVKLEWIYNNYLAYSVYEAVEDSKAESAISHIVAIGDSKIEPIKDIRDMFSESSLLEALKQDWIIRNSNNWEHFGNAQTWDQFWNFQKRKYGGLSSGFQSYSNKLNKAQISKVMECAKLAAADTSSNAGFACVNSKKAPAIYMFNYEVVDTTLVNGFSLTKMDGNAVYVRIPLMSESSGGSNLSLALPRGNNDFFLVLQ